MPGPFEIEFYGATREVTGSCHIVRAGGQTVLLECGLIQGGRQREARNREPFPFDVGSIDAVVLSHAHIDHCGRLPLLVRRGYSGPIHVQETTARFCAIMLEDSARLAEADAERENRKRERKELPLVKPLYTAAEVTQTLAQFVTVPYLERREILPGITLRYVDAGHILGSASVELWLTHDGTGRKLVFSGDLGQYGTPILKDPARNTEADLVLMESTYGDRRHRDRDATVRELATIIQEADHRRGNVLIPAFAVGRTQELLYLFGRHYEEWDLARWKICLDSPMAIRTSRIYWDTPDIQDPGGLPRLPNLLLAETAQDSQAINRLRSGVIVIAGSGMCEGGRIVHHLKHNLWRPECEVIIVGYQAAGTLGRRLVDGNTYVRIHGETVRVRARIHTLGGLSAHGDQDDLARWYGSFSPLPPVYLVHGESAAAEGLAARLRKDGAPRATVAERGMKVDLATLS